MARLYLSEYESYYNDRIAENKRVIQDWNDSFDHNFRPPDQRRPRPDVSKLIVASLGVERAQAKLKEVPTFEEAIKTYNVENSRVLRLIEEHFNLEEIKTLTFELGIDYDNLAGQEKSSKARELILTSERSGNLKILVNNARRRRPNADWDSCLYTEL